jgi:hypothetical protein|tara:strand:+ start:598 stop:819 length:222 start_codon:yes stop_codon:yes gene_type:complete
MPLSELSSRQLVSERHERFRVFVVCDSSASEFRLMEDSSKLIRIAKRNTILTGEARTGLASEESTIGKKGQAS